MLTSVVSSSRSVGFGRVSVGFSDATRTGSVRTVRCGGARATCRWTRLSLAVGKRSLNCGLGKRSSKLSPDAAVGVRRQHAGARRLAALNQNERQRHKRQQAIATQRHPMGAGYAAARPGDATRLAHDHVIWNFGFAPTIHPLPQEPPGEPAYARYVFRRR